MHRFLSRSAESAPILGGAKLTGKMGALSIGALNMQTQKEGDIGGDNYSVLRLRQDLFSRSSVGGIFTNRSGNGSFNRTAGVDTRLLFLNNLALEGFFIRSATPGVEGEEDAYHAKVYWRTDLWDLGAGHLTLEPDFNPEMGFAGRFNNRKSVADIAFKPISGLRSGNGSFNRTAGVDTRLLFLNNLALEGFFIRSATPGVEGEEDAYHAKVYWRTDLWDLGAGHLTLEPNFNAEMGFAGRFNNRKSVADIAFKPRPDISWLRQVQLRAFYEYFTTADNVVAQKVGHYPFIFNFENGDTFRVAPHTRFDRLTRPLRLAPGVEIPPGDYDGVSWSFTYTVDPSRPLAGMVRYAYQGDYFGGTRAYWLFRPQWKPTPSLIVDLDYDFEDIRLPQKQFYSHIVNLAINYSLSTRLITSTVLQYNNLEQIKGVNFRLNYIYRPGDDLFIVYRDIRNQLNPAFSDRAILVKFTRSFDF